MACWGNDDSRFEEETALVSIRYMQSPSLYDDFQECLSIHCGLVASEYSDGRNDGCEEKETKSKSANEISDDFKMRPLIFLQMKMGPYHKETQLTNPPLSVQTWRTELTQV